MTGLDFQTVPVAFTQGQDTRTNPKLVVPGKWQQLINMSLSQDGTPRRRDGSKQLVTATANGLALHGDELLAINGSALSTYSPANASLAAKTGEIANCLIAASTISDSGGVADQLDCGSVGSVTCTAWRDWTGPGGTVNGINVSVVDETTGAVLASNVNVTFDANANCPRVVADSSGFMVLWMTSSGGNQLRCAAVTAAGVVGAAATMLGPDPNIPVLKNFDAVFFNAGTFGAQGALIAYRYTDGISSLTKIMVGRSGTTAFVVGGPTQLFAEATVAEAHIRGLCLSTYANGNAVCFFVQDTGTPGLGGVLITPAFANSTPTAVIQTFTQSASECNVTATRFVAGAVTDGQRVFSDQLGAGGVSGTGFKPITAVSVNSSLAAFAHGNICNSNNVANNASGLNGPGGPFIAGKAFATNGNTVTFLPTAVTDQTSFGTQLQNSYFILDGATGAVLGRAFYGAGLWGNGSAPTSTPLVAGSTIWPVSKVSSVQVTGSAGTTAFFYTVPAKLILTPNMTAPHCTAELGGTTYFAGGQLTSYDGAQLVEHGFPLFPENFILAQSNGAGAVTLGTHQVVVVYEWIDASGKRHQSSPSPAVSFTVTAGNNTLTATVPTLLISQKARIYVVPYVTEAGGTVFYRYQPNADVLNGTSAATVIVNILASDASLKTQEALYAQPNEAGSTLTNDAPPPCKALCVSQNRLVLLSADNNLEYRFSQEQLNGFGLQFSGLYGDTTLGGLVPSDSGGTVAVAALDEKTIVLCARKLYVIYGSFPDPAGDNSTLTEPQEIPSPVGCSDARSVLAMPQGLMFKAQSGWHLLGRDLSAQYIGEGVSAFDGYTVVSATLMRDRQECRFEALFSPGVSGDGVTLVFSYLTGQWSVFYRGSNLLHPTGAQDALWYPSLNQYVWAATTNGVFLTGGVFADMPNAPGASTDDFQGYSGGVQRVKWLAKTAWLRVSGLEGFQRVRRMYLTTTPLDPNAVVVSTLALSIALNDDPTPVETVTADLSALAAMQSLDLRHKLAVQKCKSVSFTLSEAGNADGANVLAGIQAMALEIGLKRGAFKLPAGQTF